MKRNECWKQEESNKIKTWKGSVTAMSVFCGHPKKGSLRNMAMGSGGDLKLLLLTRRQGGKGLKIIAKIMLTCLKHLGIYLMVNFCRDRR